MEIFRPEKLNEIFEKEFNFFFDLITVYFNRNNQEKIKEFEKVLIDISCVAVSEIISIIFKKPESQKNLSLMLSASQINQKDWKKILENKEKNIDLKELPEIKPVLIEETEWYVPDWHNKNISDLDPSHFMTEKKTIYKERFYLNKKEIAVKYFFEKLDKILLDN